MMKILFRRYLSGEINEDYLLEHLKFDTLDQLHRLLLEMYEVNEEGLRKVLLFWIDALERIPEGPADKIDIAVYNNYYVRDIKSLQNTGSLYDYKTQEIIEVFLNFKVMQKILERLDEISKDSSDCGAEDLFGYTVEHGYVIGLGLHEFGLRSIKEIDGLQFLTRLRELNLAGNLIEKIEGLETLVNLEGLSLGDGNRWAGNQISKIEGLDTLTKLASLDLSFNHITKLEGLAHLENLEYLDLMYNQITEIEGLESLKKLEEINLKENPVDRTRWEEKLYEGRK